MFVGISLACTNNLLLFDLPKFNALKNELFGPDWIWVKILYILLKSYCKFKVKEEEVSYFSTAVGQL